MGIAVLSSATDVVHTTMATSMKIVSNKAIASAAVSSRRTGLAKRSGAISARSNVSGLRKLNKEPARSTSFIARSGIDGDEILATVTEKWESVEDKPQAILYAGGAVVAVVLVNSVVGAVNSLPLLPKSSRAELAADIEELKAKIAGGSE